MRKRVKAILLFGPPGSGKGSLGEMLAEREGHVHLSSGDIFRGLDPESEAGKLFHSYAGKGKLVPDEVTIQVFEAHLDKMINSGAYHPEDQMLLMDGIPRNRGQAEVLDRDIEVVKVILLDVKDLQILIDRIQGRAVEQGRMDDQDEEVLRQRFRVYEEQTRDVLSYYPPEIVKHIDAQRTKQEVLEDVIKIII